MKPDYALMKAAFRCRCPKCQEGALFRSFWSQELNDKCPSCDLDLADSDVGDGPAVFLIFILGFGLVPLALWVDALLAPPLWVHGVLWLVVALGFTLGSLKPIKSYIIALQYKYRISK